MNRTSAVEVSSHAVLPSLSDDEPWVTACDGNSRAPSVAASSPQKTTFSCVFGMSFPPTCALRPKALTLYFPFNDHFQRNSNKFLS